MDNRALYQRSKKRARKKPVCAATKVEGPRLVQFEAGGALVEKYSQPQGLDIARKDDAGKLRMELVPVKPLQDIAAVLTFGAKRYSDRNWESGLMWSRVYGAALRHLTTWWNGDDLDDDSGLSHLAHAACCLLFLLEYKRTHAEMDDRPAGGV